MTTRALRASARLFDSLERRWESLATQKRVATVLVAVFVVGLVVIEARRQGWFPPAIAAHIPTQHFGAILPAFSLLLLAEVISLVFALAKSVASAVGKQLEIMSLILIRQSFKELTHFNEPITWGAMSDEVARQVLYILSDATGALLIFALLAVYSHLQHHRPITKDADEQSSFVAAKKFIALLLFVGLGVIGIDVVRTWAVTGAPHSFFEVFYTLLIFADVLVVLISMRYSTAYPVVFRYFGFAVSTVLIRLALTAPRVIDAGLGVTATLFAIALTWVYNRAQRTLGEESSLAS
ncbi:MAG: hypothetical protein P8Y93_11575 [Acidobacteriota bacterium]